MAPRVMTVSGLIPPDKLGFTLPHEHTGISLWHIANRWDYWELTVDDEVILDELRDFRRRGGERWSTSPARRRPRPGPAATPGERHRTEHRDGHRLVPRGVLPR